MLLNCQWLPPLEFQKHNETDICYMQRLYEIFSDDFLRDQPTYYGQNICIRHEPYIDNRVQAFYHVTTYGNDKDRKIDEERCKRIRWIRAFIEHSDCNKTECDDCSGMKLWATPYKSFSRIKIFLEEEKYLIVLEKRESYILLITAFYVDYGHHLRKLLKEYEKAKRASA